MPATSKAQRRLFALALAVKRGEVPESDVDDKIKDRIFSTFTSGRSSHIGLGLAICLDLALALEGRLNLARSSDEGCAFRLQLPATILAPA